MTEDTGKKDRKKSFFWRYCCIPLLSIIAFILLLELGDRVYCAFRYNNPRYLAYPFLEEQSYMLPPAHRVASTGMRQYEEGYYKMPTDGTVEEEGININSLGFRGEEFSPRKRSGTVRIFCTGGSQTFSSECPDGQSYPDILEEMLNSQPGGTVSYEVINAGFQGYTTSHILNLIQEELCRYKPDLITVSEAFTEVGTHTMVLNSPGKRFFWMVHMLLFQRSLLYSDMVFMMSKRGYMTAGLLGNISRWFATYTGNLHEIARLARKHGIKLVFVQQPILSPEKRERTVYKGVTSVDSNARLETEYFKQFMHLHNSMLTAMADVAREEGVLLIDPRPALSNHHDPKQLYTYYMHFSPAGSRVMAEQIYNGLTKSGILSRKK